jgi:hypothetical protein
MTAWRDDEVATQVAQAMTDIEPANDLEARVRARIDAASRGRGAAWPIGAMTATAAAVVLAVALWPQSGPTIEVPPVTPTTQVPVNSPAVPAAIDPVVDASTAASSFAVATTSVRASAAEEALSEAERAWMARRIPALPAVEALPVEFIALPSIQPEPLSITPLTMAPLTGAPVTGDPNRH